jgi:hypothetical protein
MKPTDHDTLTGIVKDIANLDAKFTEKFNDLKADIKEVKEGTIARVAALEQSKADKKVVEELQKKINEDIEKRVAIIESWKSGFVVTLAIYGVIGGFLAVLLIHHLMQ